jgi:hypothetical protein
MRLRISWVAAIASLFFTCCAFADDGAAITPRMKELMQQITSNVSELAPLAFPRPERVLVDREMETYNDCSRWYKRDMTELLRICPQAKSLTCEIGGRRFCDTVNRVDAIISENDKLIGAEASNRPNPKALMLIDRLRLPVKSCFNTNEDGSPTTYERWEEVYQQCVADMAKAKEIDPRIFDRRKTEIAFINDVFIPKYLEIKKAHDEQEKLAREAQEAVIAAAEKADTERYQKMKGEAKQLGFDAPSIGIVNTIDSISQGMYSLKASQKYLIYSDAADDFRVQSVMGDYIIYACDRNSREIIQIAVVRDRDQFYGEGNALPGAKYKIIGSSTFQTVLGAQKDLIIFKAVE